jgi:hypothetical protein
MFPASLMHQPAVIIRQQESTLDALGRPTMSEDYRTSTVCRLVRRETDQVDPNVDGLLVTVTNVFLPTGTDIAESDRLLVDGVEYTIIAALEHLSSPFGGGYIKATVRRTQEV